MAGNPLQGSGRLVAGRYRVRSLLGRGGMGRVWLADDEMLERPVAVKQILLGDEECGYLPRTARARALGEARAAARVRHPGVVTIHDVVKEGDQPWIVMELLSGRSLAETISAGGPLPVDEVRRIGLCLVEALGAAHRAGVVHGDVKPANLHLCADGRVVLTDFGIARTADADTTMRGGELTGSPGYLSPERLAGRGSGPESDMFALGATLFAAVEGFAPFDRGDLLATITAITYDAPVLSPRSAPLRPAVEGLLAKQPEQRLTADRAHAALLAARPARTVGVS